MKLLSNALRAATKPTERQKPTTQKRRSTIISNDPLGALRGNSDIMGGLIFSATMEPRTPLRVLLRHGEVFSSPRGKPPKIAKVDHEGIWIPLLHGQKSIYGSMSSSVGTIPTDGGAFLTFLIRMREIVESDAPTEDRIRALSAELSRPQWADYVEKLEPMPGDLVRQFFPRAVDTIPKLSAAAKDALIAAGIDTARKVARMPDAELLKIKGIGKARLTDIRAWQESVKSWDADRLEVIER